MAQGPYAPAAGIQGTTAIHKDSTIFISWGQDVTVDVGFMDINNQAAGYASYGSLTDALGAPDDLVISLGDNGIATYTFDSPIVNGDGPDFAIFENAFDDNFLELALVEVSSNGVNFHRFPSVSLTQDSVQTDAFGSTDPTMIYNLAGKYRKNYGTPFDLEELSDLASLDLNHIVAVRIIDVIGNINDSNNTVDSEGNIINDPYPTEFDSSGFDLDAIGIIHAVSSIEELNAPQFSIHPNPTRDRIVIRMDDQEESLVQIFNHLGQNVYESRISEGLNNLNTLNLNKGIYFVQVTRNGSSSIQRLVKI